MGWYTHWFGTRYYTLLYGHRDDADAATWVDAILGRWQLPARAHLLDMACGRGRHARHFALRGMRTTGIDISDASIADARVAAANVEFHVHDMREVFALGAFDGICCLFTSLGYFDHLADDQLVFHAAAKALKPGGFFVLDFMNTEVVLRDLVGEEVVERDGVHFRIARCLVNDVLVKRVTVTDGAEVHLFEERVQALDPTTLESMARNAGLEILDRTDGPVLSPFDPQRSARFVLWTRKPLA